MNDFDDIIRSYELSANRSTKERLLELIAERGPVLTGTDVTWIREQTGYSRATIYAHARGQKPAVPVFESDATFLDRMAVLGQKGFVFDNLAFGILAAHGGNMKAFHADVCRYLADIGATYTMPSRSQLSRRLHREVPFQIRDGLRNGHKNRFSTTLRGRWEAEHVLQMVQLDEFILDFACLTADLGIEGDFVDANGNPVEAIELLVGDKNQSLVPIRPRLLLLVDAKSRFITGWSLLNRPPKSEDTLALLADALDVRPAEDGSGAAIGGHFDVLVSDNAQCFRSQVVEAAMSRVGSQLDIAVGYNPVAKGKVERLGATIQAKIVTALPGHLSQMVSRSGRDMLGVATNELLSFEAAVEITRQAIYEYNYLDVHSTIGCTPFEAFTDGCPQPRRIPDEDLASLMLPGPRAGGVRKVLNDGLQVFNRRGFLDPALARPEVFNKTVHVKVFPHRQDKVAVYRPLKRRVDPNAEEFVCFATDSSLVDKATRKNMMNLWMRGARDIDQAVDTAHKLRNVAAAMSGGLDKNLTAAAVAAAASEADSDELFDAVAPPERANATVNPPRRPKTRSGKKPMAPEDMAPATSRPTEADELDLLEAGLTQALDTSGTADPSSTKDSAK
jgi:transposase InsO family protein